jgi:hypothetical protein
MALVPMTDELFNEINKYRVDNVVGNWEFLTTDIENEILDLIGHDMLSYIEAEYHGGQGGIIWKEGKRIFEIEFQQDVINDIRLRLTSVFNNILLKLTNHFFHFF